MAKTTPNKKKQPAEIETLRETITKTEVVEKTEGAKAAEATKRSEVEAEETKTVATESRPEKTEHHSEKKPAKTEKKEETLSVDDLTGALENHKTRKKPLMTALVALLTIVVVIGLTVWFLYLGANQKSESDKQQPDDSSQVEEKPEDENEIKVIEGTDYAQDIKGANGVTLDPVYYLGTKDNFTLIFTNLNCDDTCLNVTDVKLGGTLLVAGQDYVTKREDGVTLIIYATTLNKYAAGNDELTFRILQEKDGRKELRTIGVKFEIKAAITCGVNQVVQNGQCINKDSQTTQPETPSVDSEQAQCEAQIGPDYMYQVHWYTEEERRAVIKNFGYDEGVIVSVMRGDFMSNKDGSKSAGMKLVNGVCRPNPNANAVTAGENSYTEANLSMIDNDFKALVMGNAYQDILVYAWKTDSGTVNYRMEYLK